MKKAFVALCLGLCSLSVFAEKAPVRVQTRIASGNWYAGPYYPRISVTALTDSVVVKDIAVNRGNCQHLSEASWKPVRLRFGSSFETTFKSKNWGAACNVLEIIVETDQGIWEFQVE
ncbi:hypothetical protein WCU81_00855 [Pectobacterium atrosepticum]|uniref:hypothetical protein n=1 Tax=Pectobacterium atrosepticum TaxID=29471 RepID=UPI0003AA1B27|nr:hypothetical protein [Pectobacterium atrosepticum]GKV84858.1 hypothetical protein PEC301296_11700 [Pectobacterium carotovorum subsp. carotovorum]AIA71670.1 hypothetical protein EV46_13985 [Pectobacterium atrosepticum]AIK13526.1 putative exported protein [Pectobacterium atrosepticum]ATY90413.1 hypothetical protein CVS35_08665 [Pectobacterium atrosepticum]KFX16370.1 hypothetical protein JV34_06155 [Pectobacterium atrosepticum]